MLTRRMALLGTTAFVAACTVTQGQNVAQGIADLQGLVTFGQTEVPIISNLNPKLVSPAQAATFTNPNQTGTLDRAAQLLAGLSASSPGLITSMQTGMGAVNAVLKVLAPFAGLVADSNPATAAAAVLVEGAIALAPGVEQLISTLTTPKGNASAVAGPATQLAQAAQPRVGAVQARALLKIPTVH